MVMTRDDLEEMIWMDGEIITIDSRATNGEDFILDELIPFIEDNVWDGGFTHHILWGNVWMDYDNWNKRNEIISNNS